MIQNWLKIFIYQLKQNKLFSALNVLGLSIGISGLIFATLYWNEEHSYNQWNPENEKVYQVISDLGNKNIWPTNSSALEPYLQEMKPKVTEYCYLNVWYQSDLVENDGKKEYFEKITDAQANFFSFFPFEFIYGSAETAILDQNSIALSESAAKRLFGAENPLGKEVTYAQRRLAVRGVYRLTGKSSIEPEVVTNLIAPRLEESSMHWGNFNFGLLLKIPQSSDVAVVESEIEKVYFEQRTRPDAEEDGISPEEYEQRNGKTGVILEPLKSSRLHSVVRGYPEGQGNYQFLLIMAGVSLLILILSIVNYINLATANAIKRAKEVGVRKILGARRSNIVWQFLFETVLMTLFAILFALAIVELSLPYYNEFLGKELLIHGSQFYTQLVIIFIVVMATAGILPSLYVSGFESLKVLKGNFGRSKSGVWLRNGMLVLQFAIAAFFISGSYIVYQQVQYMSTKDLGFSGDQVLQINYKNRFDYDEENVQQKAIARYMMLRDELSKIPGVKQVATGSFSFGTGANSSSGFVYNDNAVQGQNMGIDFGMLEMMKIKIVKGRSLDSRFASDTISSVLINETAAKMMNEKEPIGKKIQWNDKELQIVGVVADFHSNGLQQEIPPMVFFHFKTVKWMIFNVGNVYAKVDPARLDEALPQIEKFWTTEADTDYPFEYDFVDKTFARTYETYVKQKNLFSLLNIIVIIIALFGLFALASYSIQRRMKEIAIRKTLGAKTTTLLRQLSRQYLIFCVIGFAIALFPTVFVFGKWLENFAFRIEIEALPFIIGFVVLSMLTLVIVLAKAYQATQVDVLKYLKYE